MKKRNLELIVGIFMIAGIACLAWLSIRLGSFEVFSFGRYRLKAVFSQIGGLKTGSRVVIAGVEIGRVESIRLEDYEALVTLAINRGVEIQDDAIASVKTRGLIGEKFVEISGLIGEKFVEISPGASDVVLKPGEQIRETQPAVDLESLIAKYVFSEESGGK